jgi:cell fate regulator YaaT (PSP1 superfamily)
MRRTLSRSTGVCGKHLFFHPFLLSLDACKRSEKKEQQLFLFAQFGQVSPGTRYC